VLNTFQMGCKQAPTIPASIVVHLRNARSLLASSFARSHMAIVQHNDFTVGIITLEQVALMHCRPAFLCDKKRFNNCTALTMHLFSDARIHITLHMHH
jgi:hypothetical protein